MVFWHTEVCTIGASEDARQAADAEFRGAGVVRRPSTLTERHMLRAAGFDVPDDVETYVQWLSPGARRRSWRDRSGQVIDLDPRETEATATATAHLVAEASSSA